MDPLTQFKSTIYDLLETKGQLPKASPIGSLGPEDSALCVSIGMAAEKFQEETALELAQASFDGIALTLLTVYRQGLPPGAKMASPAMQQVAEIISKAGEDERTQQGPEDRSDDVGRDETPDLAAARSDDQRPD